MGVELSDLCSMVDDMALERSRCESAAVGPSAPVENHWMPGQVPGGIGQ